MHELINQIQQEIRKIIIGKDDVISKILMAILAEGHILMEDVPGVVKTTMALAFARVLGLDSRRVQFTSDSMPSDIIGFSVYDKESGEFVYKAGAVMTNLLLADEINRTSSKTQSALLEAMEEQNVTVDGRTYSLPYPFVVLATQNPIGSAGTQMLPNSQLDRFLIRVNMGYPDFQSQVSILRDRSVQNPINSVTGVTTQDSLTELIKIVSAVHVSDPVYEYITELTQATRENPMVQLGISPRGAIAVCKMAKAHAYVSGNDYVKPQDVKSVFPYVCGHRLVLNSKARLNEKSEDDILNEVISAVKIPDVQEISV